MSNTLAEIQSRIYKEMWEPSDSTEYDATDYLTPVINEVQSDIIKWGIKREDDGTTLKSPDLRFMRKKSWITWHSNMPLTAGVATTDTTISFTATDSEDSWHVMIDGDVIEYTGKTATTITGCTGIDTTHEIGDEVRQVYLIPTSAYKTFWFEDTNKANSGYYSRKGNFVDYKDFRDDKDTIRYYTVVGDNASVSTQYIDISGYSNWDKFILHYYNNSTDMSAVSDVTDLPENYWLKVLATIVSGKILYKTDEAARGIELLRQWYAGLETMYNQYSDQIKEHKKTIKTPGFNFNSSRSFTSYQRA